MRLSPEERWREDAADLDHVLPDGRGLDLVTPSLQKSPGRCIDALNYEPTTVGGYRRINGYERFDGDRRRRRRATGSASR